MTIIKYQIQNASGESICIQETIRDAVLSAAAHDGYVTEFKRDSNGAMRLYTSSKHIGNNGYFPKENEAFSAESLNENDDEAEVEVANEIFTSGVFHSKYSLRIAVLEYENNELQSIDGVSLSKMSIDSEISVEDLKEIYS